QIGLALGHNSYRSSISRSGLLKLEALVEKLSSPKWPDDLFGRIDDKAANRGKVIYHKECESCHAIVEGTNHMAHTKPYPVAQIGTDPAMTVNVHTRTVETGPLNGQPKIPLVPSAQFGPTALATEVVANAADGAI